jgi:hypothetical protein
MDIFQMGLVGLVALGAVNVVTFFKPDMDSKLKFAISLVVAFLVAFVPLDIGNIILDKLRLALEAAFAASGTYKLFTKAGGE